MMENDKEKLLTARLELLTEIRSHEAMMLHAIKTKAGNFVENFKDKKYTKKDHVELTPKEFSELYEFLFRLSHAASSNDFQKIDSFLESNHEQAAIKQKILSLLS